MLLLFISGSFDLSWDSRSQAYVTIHEMYHIFQLSNVVDFDYDLQQKITGKRIGSDNRDKPFGWRDMQHIFLIFIIRVT